MSGAIRGELLRLRKRFPLLIILLGVPALAAAFFILGFSGIYDVPPFDEASARQELINQGYTIGLPPEEAERLLDEAVEQQRRDWSFAEEGQASARAAFLFPYSLAQMLNIGVIFLFALVLLAATTIGDEFSWGTLRTSLLASTRRRRFLLVRFGALVMMALLMLAALLALGAILPTLLDVAGRRLPATLPTFDYGALAALLGGLFIAGLAMLAFAVLVTLLVRHGAVTLIAVLVWFAVEAAILTFLMRFESFQGDGKDAWALDLFPLHGLNTLMSETTRAAIGFQVYSPGTVSRSLDKIDTPIAAFAVVAIVLTLLAFRRFERMDVVE